jgi:hypothetical protein
MIVAETNTRRQTVQFPDGLDVIDRRTLLARGSAALAALVVTGCSTNEPRTFSAGGLERLGAGLKRHVQPSVAPGAVGLVARGEEVDAFVVGKTAFDGRRGDDARR